MPGAFFSEDPSVEMTSMVPPPHRADSIATLQTQTTGVSVSDARSDDSLSLLNASSEDGRSVVEVDFPGALPPPVPEVVTPAPAAVPTLIPTPAPTLKPTSGTPSESDDDEFVVVYDSASEGRF